MAKNVERLQAREAKELIRREKQLGARRNKFYMIYLFMILSLIYITDEMASTISIQFQANIVTEFFVKNMGMEYGAGLSLFSAIGFISYPVTVLIIFYRPLADKFGRKPFLVINTLCMGLGLFLVYLSKDIYVYMIGGTLMSFMVSHDMQCVYILECSDEKSRARNYAIVKAVAILGTLLVPLLRATLMQNVSERWHVVYLVPAIIGFVMALFALLFAKETNAFLTKRIEYLKTPIEERKQRSKEECEQNAQGGILTAVKFAFRHRQLRFLIIACCCFYLASLGTATYSTVMAKSALMTEEEITLALFRRQRAVYVDIGFCVGQIRAQNNYNCDVLFGVGVLFAVYFKRYVQVDSVFDRLCNRRIYGQLLGRGRYYRRNNVLRVFSYKLAFVRNCNQHVA